MHQIDAEFFLFLYAYKIKKKTNTCSSIDLIPASNYIK